MSVHLEHVTRPEETAGTRRGVSFKRLDWKFNGSYVYVAARDRHQWNYKLKDF